MNNQSNSALVDEHFDVRKRLELLKEWKENWQREEDYLMHRIQQLDPTKAIDCQEGVQIAVMRRQLRMQLVKEPLEINSEAVQRVGGRALRENLVQQIVHLSKDERLLWLQNFIFIMTPELRQLNDKVIKVQSYCSLGQQRNFLIGGQSGMGKTAYLNWLAFTRRPVIQLNRNLVRIVKVDAQVGDKSPRVLPERLILACGRNYLKSDREEDLLHRVVLLCQQCGVEVIIIDEVQHILNPKIRRRVLEISNMLPGIPIICASTEPLKWTHGDSEVEGRWNDYFHLKEYEEDRLSELLAFIELLLPFTKDSHLPLFEIRTGPKKSDRAVGPAKVIQECTKGVLRDVIALVHDASVRAIEQGLTSLSPEFLDATWKDIQTQALNNPRNGRQMGARQR